MKPAVSSPESPALPGRRATVNDVAQEAGVSRTTVSFVLTGREGVRVPETTRQRIYDAAEKLGYRRNALGRALQSGRMDTIGIVAPMRLMTSAPGTPGAVYFKDMVLAVSAAAFEAGLNPMFLKDTPSHKISLADLSDRRVDGVVLFAKTDVQKFLQDAEASHVPYVTIGSSLGMCQVHTDNEKGGFLATEHLLELGHRRIGYVGFCGDSLARELRPIGYRRALEHAGVSPNAAWEIVDNQLNEEMGVALRKALSGQERPTAIFCYNDELAIWLLDRCQEMGLRVPEDISIVSFDDSVLAVTTRPRLTTIHSPLAELAEVAIELLRSQIQGKPCPTEPTFIQPVLVERDSTCQCSKL